MSIRSILAPAERLIFPRLNFWTGCLPDESCCGILECGTELCDDGDAPEQYQIDLAGITNGDCSNCGNLNASYILTNCQENVDRCTWNIEFTNVCDCGGGVAYNLIKLELSASGPNHFWDVYVRTRDGVCALNIGDTNMKLRYRKTNGATDCLTHSLEDIPFVEFRNCAGLLNNHTNNECNPVSSTCKLTAV